MWRRQSAGLELKLVFPALCLAAAVGLLTVGGGYQGAASHRHVLPFLGVGLIAVAHGVSVVAGRTRALGIATAVSIGLLFGAGQVTWHSRLAPDPSPAAMVACLGARGVSAAYADYWVAYPLIFLSEERLLVVPEVDNLGRYQPYQRAVRATGTNVRVEMRAALAPETPVRSIICDTPSLVAFSVSSAPR